MELYWENRKENGSYRDYGDYIGSCIGVIKVSSGLYYIGKMEKKMETTLVYWGYIKGERIWESFGYWIGVVYLWKHQPELESSKFKMGVSFRI